MSQAQTRIGLIGYGQIGQAVHQMIDNNEDNGMEVVFVHDQFATAVQDLSTGMVLEDLGEFESPPPMGSPFSS